MRMVKTQREIDILSYGAFETEKALTTGVWEARPGDRELDVSNNMIFKALHAGGIVSGILTFGAGKKSIIAHPTADKIPLKYGDILSIDFAATFEGYYADINRTAVVGEYDERQDRLYTSLYDVQRYLIDMVRPGVKACDIYFKAIELLHAAGLDLAISHVGHGLGIGLHEDPLLSPVCQQPLLENMVINIEPFSVSTGEGYSAEDTMLVTKDGAKILSSFADHSKILCTKK
jgi:Xaa-Pro aminopeptidase